MDPRTQELADQVTATVGVEASAIVLINGFAARLQAAIDAQDWGQIVSLKSELTTSSTALADAVAANQPA